VPLPTFFAKKQQQKNMHTIHCSWNYKF